MSSNIHAAEIGDTALPRSNLDRRPTQQGKRTRGLPPRDGIVTRCVGGDAFTMSQDHDEGDKCAGGAADGEDLSAFRCNELIPPADHRCR